MEMSFYDHCETFRKLVQQVDDVELREAIFASAEGLVNRVSTDWIGHKVAWVPPVALTAEGLD